MIQLVNSVIIRNHTVYENGKTIFHKPNISKSDISLDDFMDQAYQDLNPAYPKFYKMDRLAKLGFLAAEILLKSAQFKALPPESIAVVLANSNASLDTDKRYQKSRANMPSPALFVYTLPNIVAGEICIRHGFKGENAFFVSPAFEAEMLTFYVNSVLEQEHMQACVAGWVNVLDEHHDVFLYLAQKNQPEGNKPHTAEFVERLYRAEPHGTINGRPEAANR